MATRSQAGEDLVNAVEVSLEFAPTGSAGEAAGKQVLLNRQMGKAVPPFQHLNDAAADQISGIPPKGRLAAIADFAFDNGATRGAEQVGHGLQGRRLARSIGAQESDNGSFGDAKRHPAQSQDRVAVNRFDVSDTKQ